MPLGSCRFTRGCLAFHVAFSLGLACSPPDGSVLFEPLSPAPAGGASGATGGAGGVPPSAPPGGAAAGGASSAPNEGQGGGIPIDGRAGAAGTSSSSGEVIDADAAAPIDPADAGDPDAPDAGPTPIPCAPSAERCDGIDNDCDGLTDEGPACPDECEGFALAEHGYMFCGDGVTRALALARCAAEQMKLAWLESSAENEAVVSSIAVLDVLPDDDEVLVQIGASDSDDEDEWFWIGNGVADDGFQFWQGNRDEDDDAGPVGGAFENWADTEPNDTDGEDCAAFSVGGSDFRDPGEWDDRECTGAQPFLCEDP